MFAGWQELSWLAQVFWAVAVVASAIQVVLILTTLFGIGHDFDHDAHADGGHAGIAAEILSLRALVAAGVGFGWAGVLAMQGGFSGWQSTALALLAGFVFLFIVVGTLRLLFSLRSDGTLNYANAIGTTGRVYVTIPAGRSGTGQVEVLLQGRLITATALTSALEPLPPEAPVQVVAVEDLTTLVVEPLRPLYPRLTS